MNGNVGLLIRRSNSQEGVQTLIPQYSELFLSAHKLLGADSSVIPGCSWLQPKTCRGEPTDKDSNCFLSQGFFHITETRASREATFLPLREST